MMGASPVAAPGMAQTETRAARVAEVSCRERTQKQNDEDVERLAVCVCRQVQQCIHVAGKSLRGQQNGQSRHFAGLGASIVSSPSVPDG